MYHWHCGLFCSGKNRRLLAVWLFLTMLYNLKITIAALWYKPIFSTNSLPVTRWWQFLRQWVHCYQWPGNAGGIGWHLKHWWDKRRSISSKYWTITINISSLPWWIWTGVWSHNCVPCSVSGRHCIKSFVCSWSCSVIHVIVSLLKFQNFLVFCDFYFFWFYTHRLVPDS